MVTVVRGDVILCDLNPVVGTEQAGVRPVLVVQIDRANTISPHTIIVPFTTRIRRALLPSHALIPAGIDGLTHDSVILCEQIRVIDKRRILRVLGHVDDTYMELTPDLVGATETQNSGIIGERVDLNLVHTGDVRPSQVLYELVSHLVLTKWRDPGEDPKLHLFGQLKRITAGITRAFVGRRPILAVLDPYNPIGSTAHVNFSTSKTDRWETDARRCHINWVILDSDWEAELCRVVEAHPRVRAYVKNHNLGLEAPYRYGSEMRKYLPDFIVLVDDGHGGDDLLHLILEIKGYRRDVAKEKKSIMETYWAPGVNHTAQ